MELKTYTKENPKKPVRSVSGVTPLTVVLKPRKCDHGTCIFCPGGDYVPQSYTNKSPAIMRALTFKFDAYEQTKSRLNSLIAMGHPTDKIELIVLGGTFLQYEIDYQYEFIKKCYDALNGRESKSLEEAKKINETSEHRCVAMCIENRPDNCSQEEIERMLEFGCTRVEIGIQILDDEIYKKIIRGHTVNDVIEATKNLKNAGFKLGYHVMPGLPYSNPEKDISLFKKIFEDERFRPDQLKIYPCQIVEDSPLAHIYKKIGYTPYSDEVTRKILTEMMQLIPEYCRVMRIMREFPKEKVIGTPATLHLRKEVEDEFRTKGIKVKEIRMREIGFNKLNDENLKLKILEYEASGGKEYFLEIVNDDDVLFGLLRLRIFEDKEYVNNKNDNLEISNKERSDINSDLTLSSLKKSSELSERGKLKNRKAIVRELHVYGQALNLGQRGEAAQHKGFGKWLMDEAEKITKEQGIGKLAVISGIGVRQYYEKLGYSLEGFYMVKEI
ncbi:tRNA uridine(34) 5-carboxymethylaminomethyl modification radical SAM/GNAT enzyme Elp3 [Candidatus Pacearchaeota archaeon]|nr:tRNA uridine(34) 5-carboxymethylaminomethyl modification radical SAM/GNAT enzyme Elp3 [Candidatus Pacearchaeota archaeon]